MLRLCAISCRADEDDADAAGGRASGASYRIFSITLDDEPSRCREISRDESMQFFGRDFYAQRTFGAVQEITDLPLQQTLPNLGSGQFDAAATDGTEGADLTHRTKSMLYSRYTLATAMPCLCCQTRVQVPVEHRQLL